MEKQTFFDEITLQISNLASDAPQFRELKKSLGDVLNPSTFIQKLFGKAAPEFLESCSAEYLAETAKEAASALLAVYKGDKALELRSQSHLDRAVLILALPDRPFIINTITECIRSSKHTIAALLHPIFLTGEKRISLSYIEISGVSTEELKVLRVNLEHAISDLGLVTEDYPSMLVRAETVSRILQNTKVGAASPIGERKEVSDFIQWLIDGGIVFLAYAEWKVNPAGNLDQSSALGLYRTQVSYVKDLFASSSEVVTRLAASGETIMVSKLSILSPVHRRERIICFAIADHAADGTISVHTFLGLLTSQGAFPRVFQHSGH